MNGFLLAATKRQIRDIDEALNMAKEHNMKTLPAVAEEIGVEYRTAAAWVTRGLLKPTVMSAGSGYWHLFDDAAVEQARLVARARQAGIEVSALEQGGVLEMTCGGCHGEAGRYENGGWVSCQQCTFGPAGPGKVLVALRSAPTQEERS